MTPMGLRTVAGGRGGRSRLDLLMGLMGGGMLVRGAEGREREDLDEVTGHEAYEIMKRDGTRDMG